MPRSRSSSSSSRGSGGMFGSSAPKRSTQHAPAPAAAPTHAPATTHHAPPPAYPAPAQPSMMGSIGSTIAQGMAFGTGSAIAHRAVGAVAGMFGSGEKEEAPAAPAPAAPAATKTVIDCSPYQADFARCLQENKSDIASCQFYMDNFNQCQREMKMA